MNRDDVRRLSSIGAIAIAACVGMDMVLVSPRRDRAQELRLLAEQLAAQDTDGGLLIESVPILTASLDEVTTEARMLEEVAEVAEDPGELFQRVESLSVDHAVRIQHLNPVPFSESGVSGVAYQITINGTFDGVVGFIDALQTLGLTRIDHVQLAPRVADGKASVNATVRSVHLAVRPVAALDAGDGS